MAGLFNLFGPGVMHLGSHFLLSCGVFLLLSEVLLLRHAVFDLRVGVTVQV